MIEGDLKNDLDFKTNRQQTRNNFRAKKLDQHLFQPDTILGSEPKIFPDLNPDTIWASEPEIFAGL